MKKFYIFMVIFAVAFLFITPVALATSGDVTISIEPQWLAGLAGVVSPFIVRWITRVKLSRRRKSLIAILVSSVIGFASAFLSGQFDPQVILQSVAVAFSISQLFYDQVFKEIFINRDNE